jgi:hypothetical protein
MAKLSPAARESAVKLITEADELLKKAQELIALAAKVHPAIDKALDGAFSSIGEDVIEEARTQLDGVCDWMTDEC